MTKAICSILAVLWIVFPSNGQTPVSAGARIEVSIGTPARKWPEKTPWKATIYGRDTKEAYEVSKEIPYDVPFPSVTVADSGNEAVVVLAFEGRAEFYDAEGNLAGAVNLAADSGPDYERGMKCAVAGGRAAFVVSGRRGEPARAVMTDLGGKEIWSVPLPGEKAGEVSISPGGRYVLAGSYTYGSALTLTTSLLGGDGSGLREFPVLFRHADFSADETDLAFADRDSVFAGRIDGGSQSAWWRTGFRGEIITGVRHLGTGVALAAERVLMEDTRPVYRNPELLLFDLSGRIVDRKQAATISLGPAVLGKQNGSATLDCGGVILRAQTAPAR